MCGITAYKGSKNAAPILLEALRKLEYRGYDSAGIVTLSQGSLSCKKGVGKVQEVYEAHDFLSLKGTTGIAHTRWATTGTVTDVNAHPHVGKRFALVQNGIVENYTVLRAELEQEGREFISQTDTEVVLHMLEKTAQSMEPLDAIRDVFSRLHGRNAFVILDSISGDIFAVKKGSPLILGIASDALLLASDATPLLDHTQEVIFVEDYDLLHLSDTYRFFDVRTAKPIERTVEKITWTAEQAQKGNYEHFMLKEIMEQRTTVADALAQDAEHIRAIAQRINNAFGTYIVGCGTAGKVGMIATYAFSKIAKKHLNFALGSEFPSYHDFLTKKSLLIAVSQSGETADTLEAIETLSSLGGEIVSVVNVRGSTMDRVSTATIPVNAGPEKSVCSTKATSGQLAIIFLLAYAVAHKYEEGLRLLKQTTVEIERMLTEEYSETIRSVAQRMKEWNNLYIIGRGLNYPLALEAAIKIQEVSYVHAEGFAGGELKHGPIALIEQGTPLVVLVADDETKEDIISNALEVKARGGFIIGIAPMNDPVFDIWIPVPNVPETSPLVNIIPVQLLAYHLAVLRGNDVDMPRNLAKSVTVK